MRQLMGMLVLCVLTVGGSAGAAPILANGSFEDGTDLGAWMRLSIEQTFATLIGHEYTVSFDLSGNPGDPGIKTVRVFTAGVFEDFSFDCTGHSTADLGWESQILSFTAIDTSTTLSLASIAPSSGFGPAIDNISVSAMPAPSSTLLLAAGLTGMSVIGRKRHGV